MWMRKWLVENFLYSDMESNFIVTYIAWVGTSSELIISYCSIFREVNPLLSHPCHLEGSSCHISHVRTAIVRESDTTLHNTTATNVGRFEIICVFECRNNLWHSVDAMQVGLQLCHSVSHLHVCIPKRRYFIVL